MQYRWRFHPDKAPLPDQISRRHSISHLAARLLVNRGIRSADEAGEFLAPSLSGLSDPFLMAHMGRAVDRILAAIRAREPIVVYGDSDVDGVCGTALLAGFLRKVGADVSTYIPNRLEEGYSLTARGIATLRERGARLVITVDNGTTAVKQVAELMAAGIDVIISDHHEPGPTLPEPLALLNPKWDGCGYPFRHLCGSGVAFQLLAGLASRIPARGPQQDAMHDLLRHTIAFVAMATICDCVPLQGENRVLARAGLDAFASTNHPGLRALVSQAGAARQVRADDISFRLGPRINAAGRLGHADRALALLLSSNADEAAAIAAELDGKNVCRQDMEAAILNTARERVENEVSRDDPLIVLADDRWHAGIVGIVAARLVGEQHRPTVLIALKDGRGRGSGRSVRRFDLHSALLACSEHLIGFGGHAYAAGLEIEADRVAPLRDALFRQSRISNPEPPDPELFIDAEVPLGVLTPSLMSDINRLAPFGEGLADPLFCAPGVTLDGVPRLVGRNNNHLVFSVVQSGIRRKAVAYGQGRRAADLKDGHRISLAFTPRLSFFHGKPAVDMEVKDIRLG